MKKLSPRVWLTLVLVGLSGQFAWTIENMYFNVYLYNTISTDPGYISAMVGWSAAAATLTTLLMGALSDRVGKRQAVYLRRLSAVGPVHGGIRPRDGRKRGEAVPGSLRGSCCGSDDRRARLRDDLFRLNSQRRGLQRVDHRHCAQ